MVQWLGLGAVTAGAWVQFPVEEPRSCMLCGRIGKKKVLKKKKGAASQACRETWEVKGGGLGGQKIYGKE